MNRRSFLQAVGAIAAAQSAQATPQTGKTSYHAARIPNEYSLLLPGEAEALEKPPAIADFSSVRAGEIIDGWNIVAVADMNGAHTVVAEKHVTHRGAILYITEAQGVIARIPKSIGDFSKIRPRPITAPKDVRLERPAEYKPGPDIAGNYILNSIDDPCYENVAALGKEYIGWTLVANEEAGPLCSLFLEADGRSRQFNRTEDNQNAWAPDTLGRVIDPLRFVSRDSPHIYGYEPGYSKRTLLGGYLPAADIGVWNPVYQAGYELMAILPPGTDTRPMVRVRVSKDSAFTEKYQNCTAESFFSNLAGIWNRWNHFFEDHLQVEIPDPWLLESARAGIVMSRCSYRSLEPTYQIGEGAYTKIPERSHALFPVAHYEFVWAHQLWNLTAEADPYFNHYLEKYVLPDGNFVYNTQDQVEAPLNVGIFLANNARAYDYTRNLAELDKRLPTLSRMLAYVLARYEYSKAHFASGNPHYGLIWGSPEADLGEPQNDFPNSHPYYYQNAVWIWRGLREHSRCLALAAAEHGREDLAAESTRVASIAAEMRGYIERSLQSTLAKCSPVMREAGITPFSPSDTRHDPKKLESYENHRFMMDWFTADWGDTALDLGHLKHRTAAGHQIAGLHTDAAVPRTSNFMEHGTLAVRIRQDDYRPFLLTLYALVCYAADSGNRYSPEDAFLPGGFPGEGANYDWSCVVNSVLQPALGLRWLLCYEENNRDVCHLQKAAPKHWFAVGEKIRVGPCPTRFGRVGWRTQAVDERSWQVELSLNGDFRGDIAVHIHPPDGKLVSTSAGSIDGSAVVLTRQELAGKPSVSLRIMGSTAR